MRRYLLAAVSAAALASTQITLASAQVPNGQSSTGVNVPHVWAIQGNSRIAIAAGQSMTLTQSGGVNMMSSSMKFKNRIVLQNPASSTIVRSRRASFEVNYDGVPGIDPDSYSAVLVKLTVSGYTRVVGDTEQSISAGAGGKASPITFSQTSIPVTTDSLGRGHVRLTPQAALDPGQYAIVLRPTGDNNGPTDPNAALMAMTGMGQGPPPPWKSVWDFTIQ